MNNVDGEPRSCWDRRQEAHVAAEGREKERPREGVVLLNPVSSCEAFHFIPNKVDSLKNSEQMGCNLDFPFKDDPDCSKNRL